MHHPDLEKQLEELKAQRKETLEDLRDIANKAFDSADKAGKTMMMFLPECTCEEKCDCAPKNGSSRPSSKFLKRKLKARKKST